MGARRMLENLNALLGITVKTAKIAMYVLAISVLAAVFFWLTGLMAEVSYILQSVH